MKTAKEFIESLPEEAKRELLKTMCGAEHVFVKDYELQPKNLGLISSAFCQISLRAAGLRKSCSTAS